MDLNKFIQDFITQFDEAPSITVTKDTNFRNELEWDSLVTLSIIAMIDEEYNTKISGLELKELNTVGEIFELIKSKK